MFWGSSGSSPGALRHQAENHESCFQGPSGECGEGALVSTLRPLRFQGEIFYRGEPSPCPEVVWSLGWTGTHPLQEQLPWICASCGQRLQACKGGSAQPTPAQPPLSLRRLLELAVWPRKQSPGQFASWFLSLHIILHPHFPLSLIK